jgi:hypothetical protein
MCFKTLFLFIINKCTHIIGILHYRLRASGKWVNGKTAYVAMPSIDLQIMEHYKPLSKRMSSVISKLLYIHVLTNALTSVFQSRNMRLKSWYQCMVNWFLVHQRNWTEWNSEIFFINILISKPNLEKNSIHSNKFFHYFHLSESSFTCPRLRASGLAWRLHSE